MGLQGVHPTPPLPGQVTALYFHSGQRVDKGERLLQLDDSTQLAQLSSDQAAVELAQTKYARAQRLFATHAASEADVQAAHAGLQTAQAAVAGDRATLAKLALRAPFAGWLGVREVSLGQYLTPGSGIATLTVWDPLRVQFTVPQSEIGMIEVGQAVSLTVDAFAGKTFEAKVSALGSEVDASSRNVTVEAKLPNPQHLLRPGMFAQAKILVGAPQQAIAVPTGAITYNTYGDFVYRIETREGHEVAVATPVRSGESRDGFTQVLSGLKRGEKVVTAGQLKLHDGAAVKIESGTGN